MSELLPIRILSLLAASRPAVSMAVLCSVAAEVVGVAGAALMADGPDHRAPLSASGAVGERVLDLCFTLGEGPGLDAHRDGVPVVESDLGASGGARWPSFASAAQGAGVAAVFAFPLRVGGVRLGALTLHHDRTGALSDEQHAAAWATASVLVTAILAHQADAPPGGLAWDLATLGDSRAEVHQACGMVAVQLGVALAEAAVRLRAHAYAEDRALVDVAKDIVARRLRLGA